jgi:hypothetical protein
MKITPPKLVLRTGPLEDIDSENLDEFLSQVPSALFASLGVIAPVPTRLPDNTLATNTAILEFNGKVLDDITLSPGINPAEIIGVLEQNAAELVVPDLVDFLLLKLRSRLPALVDTALASSTKESISTTLRAHLESGKSIKNLSGILEEILAETV